MHQLHVSTSWVNKRRKHLKYNLGGIWAHKQSPWPFPRNLWFTCFVTLGSVLLFKHYSVKLFINITVLLNVPQILCFAPMCAQNWPSLLHRVPASLLIQIQTLWWGTAPSPSLYMDQFSLSLKSSLSDPKEYKWFWKVYFEAKSSNLTKPGKKCKGNMTFQSFNVAACLRKRAFTLDYFDEMHRSACCSQ